MTSETFEERRRQLDETERQMWEQFERSRREVAAHLEQAEAQFREELARARAELDREEAEALAGGISAGDVPPSNVDCDMSRRELEAALQRLDSDERQAVESFEEASARFTEAAADARRNFQSQREELQRCLAAAPPDNH